MVSGLCGDEVGFRFIALKELTMAIRLLDPISSWPIIRFHVNGDDAHDQHDHDGYDHDRVRDGGDDARGDGDDDDLQNDRMTVLSFRASGKPIKRNDTCSLFCSFYWLALTLSIYYSKFKKPLGKVLFKSRFSL